MLGVDFFEEMRYFGTVFDDIVLIILLYKLPFVTDCRINVYIYQSGSTVALAVIT